jgi:hypothetical protein
MHCDSPYKAPDILPFLIDNYLGYYNF